MKNAAVKTNIFAAAGVAASRYTAVCYFAGRYSAYSYYYFRGKRSLCDIAV